MKKDEILALAGECGFKLDWAISNCTGQFESFYHAAIAHYKDFLMKEAGEPVLRVLKEKAGGTNCDSIRIADESWNWLSLKDGEHQLYTPDQLAAAIIKATKPMEDEVERLKSALTQFLDQEGNPPSDTGEWRYVLQVLGESK